MKYSTFRFKISALKVDIPAYSAIHNAENPRLGLKILSETRSNVTLEYPLLARP